MGRRGAPRASDGTEGFIAIPGMHRFAAAWVRVRAAFDDGQLYAPREILSVQRVSLSMISIYLYLCANLSISAPFGAVCWQAFAVPLRWLCQISVAVRAYPRAA